MTLYIARNGEKIGPLNLAQAQIMVQNGSASATDLAWYEGLPSWIPLNQVPGFSLGGPGAPSAILPQPERPIGVWIVCVLFFICIPCSGICLVATPFLHQLNAAHTSEIQLRLEDARGVWNYYVPQTLNLILSLIWAIQLFRLKKNSIWFFIAAVLVSMIGSAFLLTEPAYRDLFSQSPFVGAGFAITIIIGLMITAGLLFYNWWLIRKGTLR